MARKLIKYVFKKQKIKVGYKKEKEKNAQNSDNIERWQSLLLKYKKF